MQHEQRFQTRRTFVEGVGHVVEQVLMATPLKPGQSVVPVPPTEPPRPVLIAAKDVPLELARQVVEAAGLVAVPPNFLNLEQLAELGIELAETGEAAASTGQGAPPPAEPKEKLSAQEMIARIKQATTFDELNALVAEEGRKTVLAAAEERAAELKQGE